MTKDDRNHTRELDADEIEDLGLAVALTDNARGKAAEGNKGRT